MSSDPLEAVRTASLPQPEWPEPDMNALGGTAPLVPLDLGQLPATIRDFARLHAAWGKPLPFMVTACLVACAGAVGNRVLVYPERDWNPSFYQALNLYGLLVGPSSSGKSPAMRDAFRPLWEAQRQLSMEYAAAMETYEDAVQENPKGRRPRQPIERAVLIEDATREYVASILKDSPYGVVCYDDEILGKFGDWDRPEKAIDRKFYLKLWNGVEPGSVGRKSRKSEFCDIMTLSLLGGAQLDGLKRYIAQAVNGANNDGLLVRFTLLAYVEEGQAYIRPGLPTPSEKREAERIEREYANTLHFLLNLDANCVAYGLPTAQANKHLERPFMRFEGDAQERWFTWREANSLAQVGQPEITRSLLGKRDQVLPRLAALCQLIETPGPFVELRALEQAIHLLNYYTAQQMALWEMVRNPGDVALLSLLDVLTRPTRAFNPERFTAREIEKRNRKGLQNRQAIEVALKEALERHWILLAGKTQFTTNPRLKAAQ